MGALEAQACVFAVLWPVSGSWTLQCRRVTQNVRALLIGVECTAGWALS